MPPERPSPVPTEDLLSSSPFATASQITSTSNPFSTSTSPGPSSRLATSHLPFRTQDDTIVEEEPEAEDGPGSLTVETGRELGRRERGMLEGRGVATGRGTFSGASSVESAATPTAYVSRSLLGILNPRSGPTPRPIPHGGIRDTDRLGGPLNTRRHAPSDATTDEGDEEDEGPPDNLMIEHPRLLLPGTASLIPTTRIRMACRGLLRMRLGRARVLFEGLPHDHPRDLHTKTTTKRTTMTIFESSILLLERIPRTHIQRRTATTPKPTPTMPESTLRRRFFPAPKGPVDRPALEGEGPLRLRGPSAARKRAGERSRRRGKKGTACWRG